VNPGAGVEPGKTLFTIANLSTVWVIANVPESQVSVLRIGAPAEVTSAVLGQNALRGTVTYVDPLMNEATRSARVRIDVANPNNLLKVGMFVEASIVSGGTSTESLTVADDAVKRIGDKTVVFIQTSPTTLAVRDVALGERVGGRQVIVSGIAPGERVVTKGSFALKSQMLKSEFAESE
jgi:cobalt-zinc-cadmium efflux system membrane fusion protein